MRSEIEICKSQRIKWIDMAKGIAILAVVIGHSIPTTSFLNQIIFSFHMPLFFILAGYTFNDNQPFERFITKKVYRLLVPYFSLIFFNFIVWFFWGGELRVIYQRHL